MTVPFKELSAMVTNRSKTPDFLLAYSTLSLFFSGPPLGTSGRAHCVYSARKECGYATCMAFAASLSRHQTVPAKCPHLANPVEEKAVFPVYDDQGNCIRTVALDIDTTGLRKALDQKETYIQMLESRLSGFERTRAGNFESANAGLPAPLTQREFQVLGLLANGATNKQIASQLHISEHTVKSHVINIFNKLGVNDRTQASVWAASHGLV
jgi:DNA-binding NarL/FixJ family response regulator